jgi:hypothetical protein
MQLTDEQRQRLEWLARRQAHTLTEAEDVAAIGAALADLDARAAEIERLRWQRDRFLAACIVQQTHHIFRDNLPPLEQPVWLWHIGPESGCEESP